MEAAEVTSSFIGSMERFGRVAIAASRLWRQPIKARDDGLSIARSLQVSEPTPLAQPQQSTIPLRTSMHYGQLT